VLTTRAGFACFPAAAAAAALFAAGLVKSRSFKVLDPTTDQSACTRHCLLQSVLGSEDRLMCT
jgi:hypothetical protein